jgi:tRNA modification GTPase
LAAEHLRRAVTALDALIGRVDVDDLLGEIFASFCIGK